MSAYPIGIFDSGVGGLTVCKAINDLLPGEHIIYFGDTGRFPYGTRSRETIIKYSMEIAYYLRSRDVKMIVVACNTASSAALEVLKQSFEIPVVGVIDAGARAACRKMKTGKIGIIGTRATVHSNSYIKSIQALVPDREVIQQQATLFVSLVEEGMADHDIAKLAVREYLDGMHRKGVRTLILGCTHFPLMKKAIQEMYPDLTLIDTGLEIAEEVKKILKEKNLENKGVDDTKGKIELYASDITDNLQRLKDVFFCKKGTALEKLVITG